ncbi:putative reverse transcriptase domain, reverse transcriptase zinc-binding domain protein [Tanacetum coccineum]
MTLSCVATLVCILKQKAKIDWLKLGDSNTAYFHKVVKSYASRNRIDSVTSASGTCANGDQVSMAFIDHYMDFLSQQRDTHPFNPNDLFCNKLSDNVDNHMIHTVSSQEIRDAIFFMGNDKSPGPDGYTTAFFKEAWDIIAKMLLKLSKNSLSMVLIGFGFHPRMIGWIMVYVTSTSFSISINGSLHGYFKGKRGLRQGGPMSPYLFTLVIEVLTLMLRRRVCVSDTFTYHPHCSDLNIINLCFVDDLFLFAHSDVNSARVIMEALDEFKNASSLVPSLPKSTAYFCNVLNYIKIDILNVLPFEEGKLLVKYLEVPLVSSRLIYRDCKKLVKKVKSMINDSKNKFLSFAGDMRKGRAKVAWEAVCLPKYKGGRGLRKLNVFDKALITTYIWSIISLKESLWVKWIHVYKLCGLNFWDIPLRAPFVPIMLLINSDLKLNEIINLASILRHLCNALSSFDQHISLDQHAHTIGYLEIRLTISLDNLYLEHFLSLRKMLCIRVAEVFILGFLDYLKL